jgi:hypothetical protein
MVNNINCETKDCYDYKSLIKRSIYTSFKVITGINFAVAASTYACGTTVLLPINTLGRLGTSIAIRNIEKKIMDYLH